jgi:glycosyltransferase involved in cell wall biosynthesis
VAPRTALVHDWLVTWGGAEEVLAEMVDCLSPSALYCIVEDLDAEHRHLLDGLELRTSFIQRVPGAKSHFWHMAPLMPLAVEQFDLGRYDVVVSSSHAVALGARTGPEQVHVSYVHSPMRFAWDLQGLYLDAFGYRRGPKSVAARLAFHYLRMWDRGAGTSVDDFVANSAFVAGRIRKIYGRPSTVIHPPVDIEHFTPGGSKGGYFLAGGRMNPFKRIDAVVSAFSTQLQDQRLVVVGDGPDLSKIEALAGPNVELVGRVSRDRLRDLLRGADAFIHAATEDFGIAMAEAQACGTPVIAFGRGGAAEIVRSGADEPDPTGELFWQQNENGVSRGVRRFLARRERFEPEACRLNAERFGADRFRKDLAAHVEQVVAGR